jgi:hypothetical protein
MPNGPDAERARKGEAVAAFGPKAEKRAFPFSFSIISNAFSNSF